MEITNCSLSKVIGRLLLCLLIITIQLPVSMAQNVFAKMMVRDGKMAIEISRNIPQKSLDSFVAKHHLENLGLSGYFSKNSTDSLRKQGWQIAKSTENLCLITMDFNTFDKYANAQEKIVFTEINKPNNAALFPAVHNSITYGINKFKNKNPFQVNDSIVTFYLKGYLNVHKVTLAGSFNQWNPAILSMLKKDSGWIAYVKLQPGKYWYKFIVDGNWMTDPDNLQNENDNKGNVNSVYFKTNHLFVLAGYDHARKISVAGSFNNWHPNQLKLYKSANSWQLPIYLAEGTHTYRFISNDRDWFEDPQNKNKMPNEFYNQFNSVITIGNPYVFKLDGFLSASKVNLIGSFNFWKKNELIMTRTSDGWEMPYVLGHGNYEFRFIVDGKEETDSKYYSTIKGQDGKSNNLLVIAPNYTFQTKAFKNAKSVSVSGDFNGWNKNGFSLSKEENQWKLTLNLVPGKHLYKYIVDGQWLKDPDNHLWEQNEFSTGNSILWIE